MGLNKNILAKLADSNKKGKEFVNEVNEFFSPENIINYLGNEKYDVLKRNKKPLKNYGRNEKNGVDKTRRLK